jgi:hypothetical protein
MLTETRNPVSIEDMKIKAIGLTVAFCFLGVAACFAADPQMGTWKLNESKSKITPGTLKNTNVVYSSMFGQVKIKADVNPRTQSGQASSTGKIILSLATRTQTLALTRR